MTVSFLFFLSAKPNKPMDIWLGVCQQKRLICRHHGKIAELILQTNSFHGSVLYRVGFKD